MKLKRAKEELVNVRSELELARQLADAISGEAEAARREVEQIKAEVEAPVAKERKEVEFDTYSAFLFTLWKRHPELDFSFFGEKAMEEVRR